MERAVHNKKRKETVLTLETREDCIQLVNRIVSLMNNQGDKPVKLRIKTEAL